MTVEKQIETPANASQFVLVLVEHDSPNLNATKNFIETYQTFLAEYAEIVKESQIIVQTSNKTNSSQYVVVNGSKARMRVKSTIIKDGVIDIEQVKNVDVVCNLLEEKAEFTWQKSKNATAYIVNELIEGNYVRLGSVTTNKFSCAVSQGKHTYRIDATNGNIVVQGIDFTFNK